MSTEHFEIAALNELKEWWKTTEGTDDYKLEQLRNGKIKTANYAFLPSSGPHGASINASNDRGVEPVITFPGEADNIDEIEKYIIDVISPKTKTPKSPTRRKSIKTPKTGGKGKTLRKRRNTKSKKNHKK